MSFPEIPNVNPDITLSTEDTIPLLLASIAFEELALAHIMNVEAEKLQFLLGTLNGTGVTPPEELSVADLLAANNSVQRTLRDVIKKEMLLQFKFDNILDLIAEPPTPPPPPPPEGVCECSVSTISPNPFDVTQTINGTVTEGQGRLDRAGAPEGRVRICICNTNLTELFEFDFFNEAGDPLVAFVATEYDVTAEGTFGTCCLNAAGRRQFTITGSGIRNGEPATFELVLEDGTGGNADFFTLTLNGNEVYESEALPPGLVHINPCDGSELPPCE